ncbi:iron ABC transporter permease [Parashewanella curva]|uniref:Iron ABC transporter permease n=1 Tax=Parashewanella curva TaxID=2338552 RepID=A0A3L8PRP4_9GAMM|nr:iron ABC transporter permease [Parashewanella curva]RLV58046.1 iron ABC transporter permease [Parashewanella curva]
MNNKRYRFNFLTRSPHNTYGRAFAFLKGLTTVGTLLLILPALSLIYLVITSTFSGEVDDSFNEIKATVLNHYILNSLLVMLGSVAVALVLAVPTAWWCSRYQFKGRKLLQVLLILPLAMPAYVSGYIYTELLDFAGPIQRWLRLTFEWQRPSDYWFFDVRSVSGACIMLALALYPYLFLLLTNAFSKQSPQMTAAAQMLGASRRRIFWTVQLPLVRPALVIGCSLIAMEALADFGTVQLFAVSTLTTAIYDAWLVYGSLLTAAKLSLMMLLLVLGILWIEKLSRRQQQYFTEKSATDVSDRAEPTTKQLCIIWGYALTVLGSALLLPVGYLFLFVLDYWHQNTQSQLWQHLLSSIGLAVIAASVASIIALVWNQEQRITLSKLSSIKLSLSSLGYVIPGTVLAIGLLIPLGSADLMLNRLLIQFDLPRVGLILSGSVFALIMAYVVRFSAIANGSVQSAYEQIPRHQDDAARMLGASRFKVFKDINLPQLRPAVFTAFLLVFIECIKELPASLLLRPFDFETLSTYVYQYASDEQLEHAALGALLIIAVSMLPLLLLHRQNKGVS